MKNFIYSLIFSLLFIPSLLAMESSMQTGLCGVCMQEDDRRLVTWVAGMGAHKTCCDLLEEKNELLLGTLECLGFSEEEKKDRFNSVIVDLQMLALENSFGSIKELSETELGAEIIAEKYAVAITSLTGPEEGIADLAETKINSSAQFYKSVFFAFT